MPRAAALLRVQASAGGESHVILEDDNEGFNRGLAAVDGGTAREMVNLPRNRDRRVRRGPGLYGASSLICIFFPTFAAVFQQIKCRESGLNEQLRINFSLSWNSLIVSQRVDRSSGWPRVSSNSRVVSRETRSRPRAPFFLIGPRLSYICLHLRPRVQPRCNLFPRRALRCNVTCL